MKKIIAIVLTLFAISFGSIYAVEGLAEIVMSQYIVGQNSIEVYFDVTDEKGEQIVVRKEDLTVAILDENQGAVDFKVDGINQSSDDGIGYLLVVDLSTSVTGFSEMKQSMAALVDNMGPKDRVSIISFGDEVVVEEKFSADKEVLGLAVENLKADQEWTKLYSGLRTAIAYSRTAGSDIPERKVIILYSDGFDYNSGGETKQDVIQELNLSRSYPIYGLQFDPYGDNEKEAMLEDLAEVIEVSNGKFVTVSGTGVTGCYDQIYDLIASEYYMTVEMNAQAGDYVVSIESEYDGLAISDTLNINLNRELTMEVTEGDSEGTEGEDSTEGAESSDNPEGTEAEDPSIDNSDSEDGESVSEGAIAADDEDADGDEDKDDADDEDKDDADDEDEDEEDDDDKDDDKKASKNDSDKIFENVSNLVLVIIVAVLFLVILILVIVFIVTGKKKSKAAVVPQKPSAKGNMAAKQVLLKPFGSTSFKGLSIDIENQAIIGSDANGCDLVYDFDNEIKGQHFALHLEQGRLYIFNVDPSGETYVNGFPLQGKRELLCDDIIAFGNIEVQILF